VEYIYIYIYFVIYLFINRYYYTIYHYQEGKEQTKNTLLFYLAGPRCPRSIPFRRNNYWEYIYYLAQKKKVGEEYDMTTGTRKNKRTTSTGVLFIIIYCLIQL